MIGGQQRGNRKKNGEIGADVVQTTPEAAQKLGSHASLLGEALARGLHHDGRDAVRVTVGSRTAILHVALTILLGLARDADGGTTVGHTVLELFDRACLMLSSEALVVALAVLSDVFGGHLAESLADLAH